MNERAKPNTATRDTFRGWHLVLASVGLFAYTIVLHRSSLSLGFNSDAFALLYPIHESGFRGSLEWVGNYHYFPVTMIWLWVQYLFFGLNEPAYQVMNIVQHGVIVVMVFGLALELTGRRTIALIAAVLFAGAAGFHEVLYWSIVGNNYHVSTFFFLLGVYAWVRYLKTDARSFLVLFSVCVGCALLSHELTLSLVPVCIVYYLFFHVAPGDGPAFWRHWSDRATWSRLGRLLIAPGVLIGAFLAMKAVMSLSADVLGEPQRLTTFLYQLLRGLGSALTLRLDDSGLGPLVNIFGGPQGAWLWFVIGAPVFVFCFMRIFDRIERVLVLWLAGQLLMTQIAIGISSRHLYVATIASTMLIGSLVVRSYESAAARIHLSEQPVLRVAAIIGVGVVLGYFLVVLPHADCRKAERVWFEPHRANLSLRATLSAALEGASERPTLYVVNATRYTTRHGILAWTFQNGLRSSIRMHFPGAFDRIRLGHLVKSDNVANGSRFIDLESFDSSIFGSPDFAVVLYVSEQNEFIQVTPAFLSGEGIDSTLAKGLPSVYSPESAPHLEWIEGGWPWLNLPPDQRLEFAFRRSGDTDLWLVVFHLAEEGRKLLVAVDGQHIGSLAAVPATDPSWTHVALPLPPPSGSDTTLLNVKLRSVGSRPGNFARVGLLSPQTSYDSESAPAFHWSGDGSLELPAGHELSVPLLGCGEQRCSFFAIFSPPDQGELRITTDQGQELELTPGERIGGWQSSSAAVDAAETLVVTLRATGRGAVRLREFGLTSTRDGQDER
jgi:hypothetical protein